MRERVEVLGKIIFLILNVLYIAITFVNDLNFFKFNNEFNNRSIALYVVLKLIWIIVLLGSEIFLYKNKKTLLKYRNTFIINTILFAVVFICFFPGGWGSVGDEFLIYWAAKNLWIWPQQGAVSGALMILSLMCWPKIWMPFLLQLTFTDLVFSRITWKLWNENKRIIAIGFEIVLCFIPIISYEIILMRMWLFSVCFIAIVFEILMIKSEEKMSKWKVAYLSGLFAGTVILRSEAKVFLILIPIVLLLMKVCRKYIFIMESVAILAVIISTVIFNYLGGDYLKYNTLKLVSFVCPISTILSSPECNVDGLDQDLINIDNVFPIEDILDEPSATYFWNQKYWVDMYEDANNKEITQFELSATKLFIKNVKLFVVSRKDMFIKCTFKSPSTYYWNIESIKNWCESNHSSTINMYKDFEYDNPLRDYLKCKIDAIDNHFFIDIFYRYTVPFILLGFGFLTSILTKNKRKILGYLLIGIQFTLLVLLIPSAHNMYYIPFYLIGWVQLFDFVQIVYDKITKKENITCKS